MFDKFLGLKGLGTGQGCKTGLHDDWFQVLFSMCLSQCFATNDSGAAWDKNSARITPEIESDITRTTNGFLQSPFYFFPQYINNLKIQSRVLTFSKSQKVQNMYRNCYEHFTERSFIQ